MKITGKKQNDQQIDDLMKKIDANGSGTIDYTGRNPS
jgi:hypothetical protein